MGTVLSADWNESDCRFFLLDQDNGSDSNPGYVDGTPGAEIDPSGKAVKTFAKYRSIIPRYGEGRIAATLIKNRVGGANYFAPDTITLEDADFSGLFDYRQLVHRGSSDLSNSIDDKKALGAINGAVGPGTGGEWLAASGSTTHVIAVDTSVMSLPAENAINKMRVRWTTGDLIGKYFSLTASDGASITTQGTMSPLPVAGDKFIIERAGVRFRRLRYSDNLLCDPHDFPLPVNWPYVAGLAVTDTVTKTCQLIGNGGSFILSFFDMVNASSSPAAFLAGGFNILNCYDGYLDEAGNFIEHEGGSRFRGGLRIRFCKVMEWNNLALLDSVADATIFEQIDALSLGALGSYSERRGILVSDCGRGVARGFSGVRIGDSSGGINRFRIVASSPSGSRGALNIRGADVSVRGVDFKNCTSPCVLIDGDGQTLKLDDLVSPSGGNTSYGVTVWPTSYGCKLLMGIDVPNTVSGSLGEISTANNVVTTHDALTKTNFLDQFDNDYIGTGGHFVSDTCHFASGEATQLAVGEIVRISGTTALRAQADTAGHCDGPLYVAVTPAMSSVLGQFVPLGAAQKIMLFGSSPTQGGKVFLSPTTAGIATQTEPTTSGQRRMVLGYVARVFGNLGLVAGTPNSESTAV